jgi:hypothetical protein
MKPEFKAPLRQDSAFSDEQRQAGPVAYSTPQIAMPFSIPSPGSALIPFSSRSRIESFHQRSSQNNSLYIAQMESEVSVYILHQIHDITNEAYNN